MPSTISRHFTHLIFKFLEEGRWNYAHIQKKKKKNEDQRLNNLQKDTEPTSGRNRTPHACFQSSVLYCFL